MIRVVFFDLGMTLVDAARRPFPHVEEALDVIQRFTTPDGRPLESALVSDVDMPEPPAPATQVEPLFQRYLGVLDACGLRHRFEPVERRVTLSAHAGAFKPDRRIFETALARLGVSAPFADCLLITESGDHADAVRRTLHMPALRFHVPRSAPDEFDDWLQAPAMIARLIEPGGGPNTDAALQLQLRSSHLVHVEAIESPRSADAPAVVRGTVWKPVGPDAGDDLADVCVAFPVEARVTRDASGYVNRVELDEPSPDALREAASYVRSLARHGQVQGLAQTAGRSATHAIETDAQGRRRLVRKGFSLL